MSDFKFSCPACGQHLSGDASYAGASISCPACGASFVVPRGALPVAVTVSAPPVATPGVPRASVAAPPPLRAAPPVAAAPPPGGPRTCGLAMASLICSIGSLILLPPLGFIPGVICGHAARKRIARNPALGGAGIAKAGLIVGYAVMGVQALALVAFLALASRAGFKASQQAASAPTAPPPMARRIPGQMPPSRPTPPPVAQPLPRQAPAPGRLAPPSDEGETLDTTPDAAGWTLQLQDAPIPAAPVSGRIHGRAFKAEKVTLEGGWLTFRQGAGFFPDLEMSVVLFVSGPSELSGRTFVVPKDQFGAQPHVWMKWIPGGSSPPETRSWTDRYALRLEFGQPAGGKLPGKLYLCVPDAEKSFIRGAFQVPLEAAPEMPRGPRPPGPGRPRKGTEPRAEIPAAHATAAQLAPPSA